MNKRAVSYARVSSDDRGKGSRNLIGQLEMCCEYALQQGWTIIAELAEDDRGLGSVRRLMSDPSSVSSNKPSPSRSNLPAV